jgi:hypothetical protein
MEAVKRYFDWCSDLFLPDDGDQTAGRVALFVCQLLALITIAGAIMVLLCRA